MEKMKRQMKLAQGFVYILSQLRQARTEEGDGSYMEFQKEFNQLLDKYNWFHTK